MMLMHEIDIDAILALCSEPDRQIFEEIAVSNEERKQILLSALTQKQKCLCAYYLASKQDMPHAIDVLTPPVLYAVKSVRVSSLADINRETTRYFGINDPEPEDGYHSESNNKKCCLM